MILGSSLDCMTALHKKPEMSIEANINNQIIKNFHLYYYLILVVPIIKHAHIVLV